MGIRRFFKNQIKQYKFSKIREPEEYELGSDGWLIAAEEHFGGLVENVPRRVFSEQDSRSKKELMTGGMRGGDRMFHHGYAPLYSKHLKPFLNTDPLNIMEVGILKGTGIAVWSKLFPKADIFALDLDPQNFYENFDNLKSLGAFEKRAPRTFEFDQFQDGKERMAEILKGKKITIFIDDGHHSDETILNTATAIKPFLNDQFVCFFEDNDTVSEGISKIFPEYQVISKGRLTIVSSFFLRN